MSASSWIAALAIAAQSAAPAPPPSDPSLSVDLLCRGRGERFEMIETKRRNKEGKTVSDWHRDRRPFFGAVELRVRGSSAEAQVPAGMLADSDARGWREVRKLAVTDGTITGKIYFGLLYSPVMTINRVTGSIVIDGSMSNFSGDCEPYDPARDRRF